MLAPVNPSSKLLDLGSGPKESLAQKLTCKVGSLALLYICVSYTMIKI